CVMLLVTTVDLLLAPSSFLSCSSDHRALHPFPTRRSSDLWMVAPACDEVNDQVGCAGSVFDYADLLKRQDVDDHSTLKKDVEKRSEEHTSELQSRENLVCRLLLEKKKEGKNSCKMMNVLQE